MEIIGTSKRRTSARKKSGIVRNAFCSKTVKAIYAKIIRIFNWIRYIIDVTCFEFSCSITNIPRINDKLRSFISRDLIMNVFKFFLKGKNF